MKGKLLVAGAFLLLSGFAAPRSILSMDLPLNMEDDTFSMYFDIDEVVETATRSSKPLRQVAENVTIITAEEIAAMRAHTLGEVLNRQPGVFISFFGKDFLSEDVIRLLATSRHHTLVMIDGVRINLNSSGDPLTNFVPLTIIKRIEIIKGAASSTWGSALGGVINIITKDTGKSTTPTGSINASYGEADSRDVSADVAGRIGKLGYYLHGGNIDSNGIKLDRYSERDSVYGKVMVNLPYKSTLTATGGYSDPFHKSLNWNNAFGIPNLNIFENTRSRNIWSTLYFDTQLTANMTLHLSGQYYSNDFTGDKRSQGNAFSGPEGELIDRSNWDDEVNSFASRLAWTGETVSANLGFETSRSEMTFQYTLGPLFGPSSSKDDPIREERRGVYANATYVKGDFSITPGLRYDFQSNSEEFVSPSLGMTYMVTQDTLLRGSIARGFSAPYLAAIALSPNLEPEITWTYQAGIETSRIPHVSFKCTLFHQNIDNAWDQTNAPWTNTGKIRLNGIEFDGYTEEFHGLCLNANFTYITEDSMGDGMTDLENDETYTANLIFSYHNRDYGVRAELAGHYYWINFAVKNEDPDHDDFLWDALIGKNLTFSSVAGEIYLKARNIFNGNQYWDVDYPNADRWVEAGMSFHF